MLQIGICDENTKDRTVIRQIVTDTLFREEELSYIEYAEAETLEQEIQASTVPFDLLLMEMKYKNTSGLQLAKQIREKNLDVDLLFVTDESDHVYEGYHVQAQVIPCHTDKRWSQVFVISLMIQPSAMKYRFPSSRHTTSFHTGVIWISSSASCIRS